jgi:hypothetical protein
MRRSSTGRQTGPMDLCVPKQFEVAIVHHSKLKDPLTRFICFSRQLLNPKAEVPPFYILRVLSHSLHATSNVALFIKIIVINVGIRSKMPKRCRCFFSKAMLQTLLSSHHAPNASFPFGPLIQLLHKIPTLLPSQLFPQAKLPLPPPQPACLNTSLLRTNTSSLNALTSSMVRSRVFSASAHLTCRSSTKLFLRLRYLVAAVRLRESS